MLSLIVPCYNEQESLPLFYKEVTRVITKMKVEYELLLIDDGSKDETLFIMKKLAAGDVRVKYFSFFEKILEKKLQCMQDFVMQKEIMLR